MADTTKLAIGASEVELGASFWAWRVNIGVGANLADVVKHCKKLKLQKPKIFDYKEDTGISYLSVVVPFRENEKNRFDSAFHAFEKEMEPFKVRFWGASEVKLTCPPAPEVQPSEEYRRFGDLG